MNFNYSDIIPLKTLKELINMLEIRLEGHTPTAQNFIIQYTYFELEISPVVDLHDDWSNDQQSEIWFMKTFLDIGTEILRSINLSISTNNTTKISVYGKNPKFGVLHITRKLDMRKKTLPNKIYACDLYIDFIPLHYHGKCYTK